MCFARAEEPGPSFRLQDRGQAQSGDAGGARLEQATAGALAESSDNQGNQGSFLNLPEPTVLILEINARSAAIVRRIGNPSPRQIRTLHGAAHALNA